MTLASRVVVLCPKVWGIRNVVHSGIAAELRRHGVEVHLLTPGESRRGPAASRWYDVTPAELLNPPVIRSQYGMAFLNAVLSASFARRHSLNSRRLLNRWQRAQAGRRLGPRDVVIQALAVPGSRPVVLDWLRRWRERRYRRDRDLRSVVRQLRRLRPSLVISTNSQFSEERSYVIAAQELGISTLACIQSFDNLTTRSVMPVFDHYAVWNERMREQLLTFYPDRDPANVHITGTPQFDFHVRAPHRWSRIETLNVLGLRVGERYLVYAPTNHSSEPELLRALDRALATRPEVADHRIVVRPHPVDARQWAALVAALPRCVLSPPWRVPPSVAWDAPEVVEPEDQARLVSTLLHADVCLNTVSTITLDAAAVDTPVVCIGFAANRGSVEDRFCAAVHYIAHFRPIMESGGVRLVRDMGGLVSEVAAYVRDRSRDRVQRRKLVESECGPVDGRAAERIAALIINLVNASPKRDGFRDLMQAELAGAARRENSEPLPRLGEA